MKILILSFIIFLFSIIQFMIYCPSFVDIEFAFKILNIYKRENKSFCILSIDDFINSIDQKYLNLIIEEVNGKYSGYNYEKAEEDLNNIIQIYFEFLQNKDICIEILANHFIPDDCRFYVSEKNILSELIIDKLNSTKGNLGIANSGEMLAIACEVEMFYTELYKFSGSENRIEQLLVDIFVFNDANKQEIAALLHKTGHRDLVEQSHKFMGQVLGSGKQPNVQVTICLVSKSILSYATNKHRRIMKYYETIVNEIKNNESQTCELSSLPSNRRRELINKLNVTRNLTKIEINGILFGFEHLFKHMEDTHIYLLLGIHPPNYKYITEQCNFDQKQFLNDYKEIIQNIIYNLHLESKERYHSLYLMKYCMLTNIKNHKQVKIDNTMINKLNKIINVYDTLTYSFFTLQCLNEYNSCQKMIINNLRKDSLHIDSFVRNCYSNKLILYCIVSSYRYKNINNDYLEIFHNYLHNYTFDYCPHKLSNLKSFADGISNVYFDIRDDKIISLRFIQVLASKYLDQSIDNLNVTWINLFEYDKDSCHLKSNINYSLIDFEKIDINDHFNKFTKRSSVLKCSIIHSSFKFIDDFNYPVSIIDWLLLFDMNLNFINNNSYKSLTDNEKFNAFKSSIYDDLSAYKSRRGCQMRMDCEIESIIKNGLKDINIDNMKNIYLYLASKYPDNSCLLDTSMFRNRKLIKLVTLLKLYPGFNILEDTKISAYALYLGRIIPNISSQLLSYIYPEKIASELVDNASCTFQKTSEELYTIVLNYLQSLYKDKEIIWMNRVDFYKCLFLKDTISYISVLYNKNKLFSREIQDINKLYKIILSDHPDLKENNENLTAEILNLFINTYKFKAYITNPIKLSMVKCYIRKLHSLVTVHSTTLTPEHSSILTINQSSTISLENSPTTVIIAISSGFEVDKISNGNSSNIISGDITQPFMQPILGEGSVSLIVIVCVLLISILACGIVYYYNYNRINILNKLM